jgi:hypothetical protein
LILRKIIVFISIITFCISFYYWSLSESNISSGSLDYFSESSKSVAKEMVSSIKVSKKTPTTLTSAKVDEEGAAELEKKFDQAEKRWIESIHQLFIEELELKEIDFKSYLLWREQLAEDKITVQKEFHEQLLAKYGPRYSYNPTEEEEFLKKSVEKRYNDLLLNLLGEQGYTRYLELKDTFNQNEMRKGVRQAFTMDY